jgi:hypothetical protein
VYFDLKMNSLTSPTPSTPHLTLPVTLALPCLLPPHNLGTCLKDSSLGSGSSSFKPKCHPTESL